MIMIEAFVRVNSASGKAPLNLVFDRRSVFSSVSIAISDGRVHDIEVLSNSKDKRTVSLLPGVGSGPVSYRFFQ
jgi:hypothetical protein